MSTRRPETPEEQWKRLEQMAADTDARAPLTEESDAEVDAALVAAGYDLAALDARGKAFLDAMLAGEGATPEAEGDVPAPDASGPDVTAHVYDVAPQSTDVVSLDAKRAERAKPSRSPLAYVVYAAAAAILLGLIGQSLGLFGDPHAADPHDTPVPHDDPTKAPVPSASPVAPTPAPAPTADLAEAARLRKLAKAACATRDYATCNKYLNDAARIDPDAESERDVVELRRLLAGKGSH